MIPSIEAGHPLHPLQQVLVTIRLQALFQWYNYRYRSYFMRRAVLEISADNNVSCILTEETVK